MVAERKRTKRTASIDYLRTVAVPPAMAGELKDLAWKRRQSLSSLLGEFLARFVERGFDGVDEVEEPKVANNGRVGFLAQDPIWKQAEDKAWELHTNRSSAIRVIAYQELKDAGYRGVDGK